MGQTEKKTQIFGLSTVAWDVHVNAMVDIQFRTNGAIHAL